MPDYKEMYLKLFRATESAISCLIATQQECEELYIRSSEAEIQPPEPKEDDSLITL